MTAYESWKAEAMRLADDYAEAVGSWSRGHAPYIAARDSARAALEAHLEALPMGAPVAHMWQHDETGRVGFVDQWQLDNGWQTHNPRLQVVAPLYRHPKESA